MPNVLSSQPAGMLFALQSGFRHARRCPNIPIHSCNQDFCVKFPASEFVVVGHIVSQIKLSCISNVYEYCCCLFPGGGFFVGRLPFQACKLGGRFGLTTSVYWVVLACIGLYWVALASPPPALGLQHNDVLRPHCKLQSEKDTDMVAAAALIIGCIS